MAVISKMPKDKASVVKLLNGIVKAEVEKQVKKEAKTKMVVKTPNAVLGVRGTKFQSIYNPKNKTTSLVTVEGQVAMKKDDTPPSFDKTTVEKLEDYDQAFDNSSEVVEVSAGEYTGVGKTINQPIEPVKISPKQYDALAKSMGSNKKASDVMKVIDEKEVEAAKSKSIKSGGYVDFQTGLYIPPAADAKINKETATFEAPEIGEIAESGEFIPPKGVKVDDKKGLVIDEKELARVASAEEQAKIKKAVLQLKKSEKSVPLVVNKSKAVKKKKPSKPWGPKSHILSAKLIPFTEALNVKNKRSGGSADVSSEGARNLIFSWQQVWNKKWSSRIRMGESDYDFDNDGVNINYYGDQNGDSEYFSLGGLYQYNPSTIVSFDFVDRKAFYVVPSFNGDSNTVEFRSNHIQTLELGVKYKIKAYEKISYHLTGMLELGLDASAPAQNNDEGSEHSGLTLGGEAEWMYNKNLGIYPAVFYHSIETINSDYQFERKALGFSLDFTYKI